MDWDQSLITRKLEGRNWPETRREAVSSDERTKVRACSACPASLLGTFINEIHGIQSLQAPKTAETLSFPHSWQMWAVLGAAGVSVIVVLTSPPRDRRTSDERPGLTSSSPSWSCLATFRVRRTASWVDEKPTRRVLFHHCHGSYSYGPSAIGEACWICAEIHQHRLQNGAEISSKRFRDLSWPHRCNLVLKFCQRRGPRNRGRPQTPLVTGLPVDEGGLIPQSTLLRRPMSCAREGVDAPRVGSFRSLNVCSRGNQNLGIFLPLGKLGSSRGGRGKLNRCITGDALT